MSWKPEVIADRSGKWCPNGLCFASADEAKAYAYDLSQRWKLVTHYRAAESADPVNSRWIDGKAVALHQWKITSDAGVDLGTYEGVDEAEAREALARDAGYRNYYEANLGMGSDSKLIVERVQEG